MNLISQTFSSLKSRGHLALMPFVPAGYPDLSTTAALLPALEQAGANLIEIGIPFSDPIADGPIIQEAFNDSLSRGLKVSQVFECIAGARKTVSIPLMAMLSYSIIFRYGVDRFFKDAKASGFDGLIIPDLPPPEAAEVCGKIHSAGLDTVLLVAPTTSAARRKSIAELSSGFVYYLSVAGITGEREQLPADLRDGVLNMKSLSSRPVCVGFGISKPAHLKQLQGVADGAIVGSAVVRQIKQSAGATTAACAKAVGDYCRDLLSLVR